MLWTLLVCVFISLVGDAVFCLCVGGFSLIVLAYLSSCYGLFVVFTGSYFGGFAVSLLL